jgi:hypothetical protein
MASFAGRMMGAAKLNVRTFEEVEAEPAAPRPAMVDEGGRSSFAEEPNDFPWETTKQRQIAEASGELEP